MGCKKLNTDFFNFLEVIHQKNATAFKKNRRNGDHLGNIRLSYSDSNNDGTITASTEIKEENNYYPFGLKMKGFNANINDRHHKYMFGGKEQQDELNLNTYDFGARNYDPALGRWMNLDPLAELMWTWSPYNYSFDSPIYYSDPTGLGPNGSNDIEGYYDLDGTVYFDPKVHGPGDVPAGAKYIDETYYDEGTGTFWDENGNPISVVEQLDEVVVTGSSSGHVCTPAVCGGIHINGLMSSGGIKARKGLANGSMDWDDVGGGTSGAAGKSSNAFVRLMRYLVELLRLEQGVEKAGDSKNSTMEKKVVKEAKNVPKKIKVVLKHYYSSFDRNLGGNIFFKIDSIKRDTVEIKTSNSRKTKDSLKAENGNRRRYKERGRVYKN